MKITVCIGSACHLKGSRIVLERLRALVSEYRLEEKVELTGKFCMGRCAEGVSVSIDEEIFSVQPDTTEAFFRSEVLTRL